MTTKQTWQQASAGDEQDAANWAYENVDALLAEVERLKRDAREVCAPTIERQSKEIERLRQQQSGIIDGWDDWDRQLRDSKAEVERLRAELRTCQETLTACIESV